MKGPWWITILVAVWASVSHADPPPPNTRPRPAPTRSADEGWRRADALWVEAERRPAESERWDAAASAFEEVVVAAKVDAAVRLESAFAAVLAWGNAIGEEALELPEGWIEQGSAPLLVRGRASRLAAAVDVYLRLGPGGKAPGVAIARYLRARIYLRFAHLDEAIADLTDIVEHHRRSVVGVPAAHLLLDALWWAARFDELIAVADRLRADASFLAGAPELAERLTRIEYPALRKKAGYLANHAFETGAREDFDRCGEAYWAALAAAPDPADGDVLLYGAAWCFERSGAVGAALEAYRTLIDRYPRTICAGRALHLRAVLYQQVARFADAAADHERYARSYPREKDAADALELATYLRVVVGELDAAEQDLLVLVKRFGTKNLDQAQWLALELARARLEQGDRAGTRRLIHGLLRRLRRAPDPGRDLAVAEIAWEAACPVMPTDGLCVAPAKDRLRAIRRVASFAEVARALIRTSRVPRARRMLADARFEAVLQASPPTGTRPTVAWSGEVEAIRDVYAGLAADPADDEVRVAAHARLGQLARHLAGTLQQRDATLEGEAREAFEACRRLAIEHARASPWLASCERGLLELGAAPARVREKISVPGARGPIALEPTQPRRVRR